MFSPKRWAKRQVNKPKRWAKQQVNKPKRWAKKEIKKQVTPYIKGVITAYLVALVPTNYINTALVNNLDYTQIPQIVGKTLQQPILEQVTIPIKSLYDNLTNQVPNIQPPTFTEQSVNVDKIAENDYYTTSTPATISEKCASLEENTQTYFVETTQDGWINKTACTKVGDQQYETMKGVRLPIPDNQAPEGWGENFKTQIETAPGKYYRGYFYNRSHLIANQLGGQPVKENLITGTRTQNVGNGSGGMRYPEQKAVDFLEGHTGCPITYEAIAHTAPNTIIPRTVTVNILSCDGTLNEKVEVYNVAKGYTINYETGEVK